MPTGFTVKVFAPAGKLTGADDITETGGHIFVAYQNGVGSKGEPAPSGKTASTLVEYSPQGAQLGSWQVMGKIDGLGSNASGEVVATVNEDGNSSLYVLTGKTLKHYPYAPKKLPHGGGTDAVTFEGTSMIVTASAPDGGPSGKKFTGPALYRVTLSGSTAAVHPVLADDVTATDIKTGKPKTLSMTDADSSTLAPASSSQPGAFILDDQADSELVFVHELTTARPATKVLDLSTQVDDTRIAGGGKKTLLVTDNKSGNVYAITGPFTPGTAYTSVPNDSKPNPSTLGTIDLKTGAVTTWATGIANPHGLLFTTLP